MLGTYKEIYLHHPPNPPPNISSLNHLVKNNPGECKAWVTATTTECERISEWDGNHTSRTEKQNEPGRSKINVFLINNRRNLSRQGHVGLSLEVRIHNFSCRSRLLQAGPAQRRIKKGPRVRTRLRSAPHVTGGRECCHVALWIFCHKGMNLCKLKSFICYVRPTQRRWRIFLLCQLTFHLLL